MMSIGSEEWLALIQDAAAQLEVKVRRWQAEQFSVHAQWLQEWNQKINLTAITDPKEVAIKHFVDAIAPLPYIPHDGHLLDIGTGGGFPGIPIKIMRPDQTVTLIDSVRKKINFVKHVIRQLSLKKINVLHTRAGALSASLLDGARFDVVVCRALANPNSAAEIAKPLLAPKGRIVLYQGAQWVTDTPRNTDSSFQNEPSRYLTKSISYQLPHLNGKRTIIVIDSIQ